MTTQAAISREDAKRRLREVREIGGRSDTILCDFLEALGFEDVVQEYHVARLHEWGNV